VGGLLSTSSSSHDGIITSTVLEFLKKRGHDIAAMELGEFMESEKKRIRLLEEEGKKDKSKKVEEGGVGGGRMEKKVDRRNSSTNDDTLADKMDIESPSLQKKNDAMGDDSLLKVVVEDKLGNASVDKISKDQNGNEKEQESMQTEEMDGTSHHTNDDEDISIQALETFKEMEKMDIKLRSRRSPFTLSTGGGMGYDLDSAPKIVLWGCGRLDDDHFDMASDLKDDNGVVVNESGSSSNNSKTNKKKAIASKAKDDSKLRNLEAYGREEARRYVRCFTIFQTWLLSLPDIDGDGATYGSVNYNDNNDRTYPEAFQKVIDHAKAASTSGQKEFTKSGEKSTFTSSKIKDDATKRGTESSDDYVSNKEMTKTNEGKPEYAEISSKDEINDKNICDDNQSNTNGNKDINKSDEYLDKSSKNGDKSPMQNKTINSNNVSFVNERQHYQIGPIVPPSVKPELLSVAFALFVHSYCELLECGLESVASVFISTYRHIFEPVYSMDLQDLDKCNTTADIVNLNTGMAAYDEAVNNARLAESQFSKAKEMRRTIRQAGGNRTPAMNQQQLSAIRQLEMRYIKAHRISKKFSENLESLPFLRRARSLQWQISLSGAAYSVLFAFLNRREDLLPMSALLQTRCYIVVERRDPLPYTPACVLDYADVDKAGKNSSSNETSGNMGNKSNTEVVRWGVPFHPLSRAAEDGENLKDPSVVKSILAKSAEDEIPFPILYPKGEYDTTDDYEADKRRIIFNRALLANGFRRLEALETSMAYKGGVNGGGGVSSSDTPLSTNLATVYGDEVLAGDSSDYADPLTPSVLLSTLCTTSTSSPSRNSSYVDEDTHIEGTGIDITCAKICPPDGRRIACGCDDSAIRIWSMDSLAGSNECHGNKDSSDTQYSSLPGESTTVLLGHKNGMPVFDMDWNSDGRTLLSAGGDGTLRLWDTMAVGPFGRLANVVRRASIMKQSSSGIDSTNLSSIKNDKKNIIPNTIVPDTKLEPLVEANGAALAVYAGHSPSTPVWSTEFAPSGYYFASAGSDSTARLWTTDRPCHLRIFVGHLSPSVNTVTWHQNCNYILTGSDDKTVRMWDVQTGQTVRLLTGCSAGVNIVKVCPSGRYVAGADYHGVVHIWELASGRKVHELRQPSVFKNKNKNNNHKIFSQGPIIRSMSYSVCGTALATGGEGCSVLIWDARGLGSHACNPKYSNSSSYKNTFAQTANVGSSGDVISKRPIGERNQPGNRDPVLTFHTRRTTLLDLQYSKRNLLFSIGKFLPTFSGCKNATTV